MRYPKIKSATVALVKMHKGGRTSFEIVGSGVCIDSQGIILTCQHVISAFMAVPIPDQIKDLPKGGAPIRVPAPEMTIPHAVFYKVDQMGRLLAFPTRVDQILSSTNQDIGLVRVLPHPAMTTGYPSAQIEDYVEIHEGLEVGICGFPLGDYLKDQIGAVTSSFTFGSISTISPYEGVQKENAEVFQLDATATHGNSGGPVFNKQTEKIIGVLQGGILHPSGTIQAGLVRCVPAYKFLSGNELSFIKSRGIGVSGDPEEMRALGTKGISG